MTLTPTQQHADELLEMCWRMANALRARKSHGGLEQEARELLDKINTPPPPPTAQELAAALAEVRDITNGVSGVGIERGQRLDALFERARATGLL